MVSLLKAVSGRRAADPGGQRLPPVWLGKGPLLGEPGIARVVGQNVWVAFAPASGPHSLASARVLISLTTHWETTGKGRA